MHRFTWDLRYPGAWMSAARPEGPNGPVAVPGKFAVRMSAGNWTETKPLTVVEDPRIVQSGVTAGELREQFEHNIRVRDLVSDLAHLVARIRSARADPPSAAALAKVNELASHVLTPSIRYSKPELQTQITYLYTITNSTDQQIGADVVERYQLLRKELDQRIAEMNAIVPNN
jgi:hypothetical protein